MYKSLIFIITIISLSFSNSTDLLNSKELTPYEEVLSGVLLLDEFDNIKAPEKQEYYYKLLTFSELTHQEFSNYLTTLKSDMNLWLNTLNKLKDFY